jgi:formylglycine-generating enzyme required for sulfatase activity
MSETNPRESDLVLGGQNPPPVDAAILGGLAGKKQRLLQKLGLSINDKLFDLFLEKLGIGESLACELSQNHDLFEFENFTINGRGEIMTSTKRHAFYYTENLENDVTLDMVYIPAGSFMMGSNEKDSEQPIHQVTLKSFYMAKYPTTQAQYMAVMGNNPSHFQGDDLHPVGKVMWSNAMTFCHRLSKLTGRNYSLPSESQWEYACRAGTTTPFYCGDTITTDFANYNGDHGYSCETTDVYLEKTTPVGKYPPNPWGLYDMHGNVWEWCLDSFLHNHNVLDRYLGRNYTGAPIDGTAWISSGSSCHVCRGGSWCYVPNGCRSSERNFNTNEFLYYADGFRLCTY